MTAAEQVEAQTGQTLRSVVAEAADKGMTIKDIAEQHQVSTKALRRAVERMHSAQKQKRSVVEVVEDEAGVSFDRAVSDAAREGLTVKQLAARHSVPPKTLANAITRRGLGGILKSRTAPALDADDCELIRGLYEENQRHQAEAERLRQKAHELLAQSDAELQKARQITVPRIAEKMGCSPNVIYRVLRGEYDGVAAE